MTAIVNQLVNKKYITLKLIAVSPNLFHLKHSGLALAIMQNHQMAWMEARVSYMSCNIKYFLQFKFLHQNVTFTKCGESLDDFYLNYFILAVMK